MALCIWSTWSKSHQYSIGGSLLHFPIEKLGDSRQSVTRSHAACSGQGRCNVALCVSDITCCSTNITCCSGPAVLHTRLSHYISRTGRSLKFKAPVSCEHYKLHMAWSELSWFSQGSCHGAITCCSCHSWPTAAVTTTAATTAGGI